MESNRYTVSGPVRQSALMRPSMIKPEVNSTKMNHEVIDTQNTEQDHRKFLETGDDALYSAENMRKRAALKEDPQIRAWITMFFRTFSMQTKPWCAGHKNVTRYQVFAFELLCCKALFPPAAFNMEEALCSVEEDLQRDLGDREQMSFHEFSESLFEIVDMWTLTAKDEYLIFLRNLYLRISEPSITGSRQFRRVDAVVSVETPDLTAILKEGEVLKADRELDDTEIQQMNDDFESSRQSDIELGIAPRGSGLEAQASEEAARRAGAPPPGGGRRRTPVARLSAQAQRRSSVAATREMARARKRSRQVTLVEPSHSSDEDETDDDVVVAHASPRGGKRPVGGRDPTLARNNARGKYQGASEPIWRAPGRRNDSHEGEYDGYDGDGRAPKKKKDGTNIAPRPWDRRWSDGRRGRPSDGVAEAVGKGGRRKKEKAIPRTAAWLFHMDQASWGGDASSLDADSFDELGSVESLGSHYVMVAAERATSAADGLFHIGVSAPGSAVATAGPTAGRADSLSPGVSVRAHAGPRDAPAPPRRGAPASAEARAGPRARRQARVLGGLRAGRRGAARCVVALAAARPPPRPPAPPGEAPAPEAPERPETEPEAAAPAPAAPPVKVEVRRRGDGAVESRVVGWTRRRR
ncbi:hypothetical protein JL722_8166 [Aureococcus anophagefferens]|nr:hypothetical protein JL722_8166 [Aureococcus anophagefferens]